MANGGGFRRAVTSLAALEQKLRRQFGLAGEIGATFKPEMTPVVIVSDLREPGNSDGFQSRSWAWSTPNGFAMGGANLGFSVRFDAPVLIDELWGFVIPTAHSVTAYISTPAQTPGVAVATFAGTWVDNKTASTDQVPILESAGAAPLTGTVAAATNRVAGWQGGPAVYVHKLRMMLPTGSHLNFQASGAGGAMGFGCSGRIWP